LRAVERTGAHDQPPASIFSSEAVIFTAETEIPTLGADSSAEADPEWEAARLLGPEALADLLALPSAAGEATAAVDVPTGLLAIPDPEDAPVSRPRRGGPRRGGLSDPESMPLRSIPLPESSPPLASSSPRPIPKVVPAAEEASWADEHQLTGIADRAAAPARPVAAPALIPARPVPVQTPRRASPPPLLSAPPPPVPSFGDSEPPRARLPEAVPEVEDTPSVVLDDEGFGGENTRVFDRQAAPASPVMPRGRLVLVQGEPVGKSWYLNRPLTFVGRANENDIVLLDLASSRKHLRLDRHAEGFRVVDLTSGNGTYLNGRRVTREEIYDGDRIEVGEHVMEFSSLGTPRPRPRDTGRVTDPGISVRPVTPPGPAPVPRSWIIVWSLATFLAVFGAMFLTRWVRRHRAEGPAPVPVTAPERPAWEAPLEAAQNAAARRDWAASRTAVEAARAAGADGARLDAVLNTVMHEEKAQLALRLATLQTQSGAADQARLTLDQIPADSGFAAEAAALRAALASAAPSDASPAPPSAAPGSAAPISAAPASAAPVSAAPVSAAPVSAAPVSAAPAKAAAPVSAPPVKVTAPATAARKAPPSAPPAAPRTAKPPRPPRAAPATRADRTAAANEEPLDPQGKAMQAYRARRFAEAAAAFERDARSGTPDQRRSAQARAQAVQTVAQALGAATDAEAAGRRGDASAALEKALAADRTLGGALAGGIQPALARHLVYEALREFVARHYPEAARKNQRALAMDPNLSQARDLARKLESHAQTLLDRARDADAEERAALVQQIQQIAPKTDIARQAQALLKE